ncbi:MAG: hypothetical protein ACJ74T_02165 [Pyrinomonadaceae bacterium]
MNMSAGVAVLKRHETHLRIAILDRDAITASVLKTIFENIPNVVRVDLFVEPRDVLNAFQNDEVNCLLVDIFNIGVASGIELIQTVRSRFSHAPICLIGDKQSLSEFPDVPSEWKKKFDHYFAFPKDEIPELLIKRAEGIAKLLEVYLRNNKAYVGLKDLRNMVVHREGVFSHLPAEKAREIETILAEGEKALETMPKSAEQPQLVIQGFAGDDIKNLVKDTLEKASNALDGTAKVNKWILVCGALLIIASFIVASVTQRWEAMTFGGFGIAGIIASLITNPLKSIGIGAKRLVILQVAYLNFLKQLSLLDSSTQGEIQISVLEKSKQLNEAMEKVIEHLDKHFG